MRVAWNKGKKQSEEVKQKIALKLKGRVPWNKGKSGLMPPNWNKGKHWDEQTKQRISNKMKGRPSWNKGRPMSAEHRQHILEAKLKAKEVISQ